MLLNRYSLPLLAVASEFLDLTAGLDSGHGVFVVGVSLVGVFVNWMMTASKGIIRLLMISVEFISITNVNV